MSTVAPPSRREDTSRHTSRRLSGSRPVVGSSRHRLRAGHQRAREIVAAGLAAGQRQHAHDRVPLDRRRPRPRRPLESGSPPMTTPSLRRTASLTRWNAVLLSRNRLAFVYAVGAATAAARAALHRRARRRDRGCGRRRHLVLSPRCSRLQQRARPVREPPRRAGDPRHVGPAPRRPVAHTRSRDVRPGEDRLVRPRRTRTTETTLTFAETWGQAAEPLIVIAAWTFSAVVLARRPIRWEPRS